MSSFPPFARFLLGEQEGGPGGPRPGRRGGKRGAKGKKRPDDHDDTSDEDESESDHDSDCVSVGGVLLLLSCPVVSSLALMTVIIVDIVV